MLGFVKVSQLKDKVWAAGKKNRLWSGRLFPTSGIIFRYIFFFWSVYVKLLRPQWSVYSKWHSDENDSWGMAVGRGLVSDTQIWTSCSRYNRVSEYQLTRRPECLSDRRYSVFRRLRQTSLSLTFSLMSKINESWANWKSILIKKKKKRPVSTCFLYNTLWALGPDFLLVYHIALSHLGDADNSLG